MNANMTVLGAAAVVVIAIGIAIRRFALAGRTQMAAEYAEEPAAAGRMYDEIIDEEILGKKHREDPVTGWENRR